MEHASVLHPLPSWRHFVLVKQYRLAAKIASTHFSRAAAAIAWMALDDRVQNPPSSNRDRPPTRWDQAFSSFSCKFFGGRNLLKDTQNL